MPVEIDVQIVIAALVAVLAFWLLGAHNRLVRLRQAARSAFAPLVSQLRQRHAVARALADASRSLLGAEATLADELVSAAQAAGEVSDQLQSRPLRGRGLLQLGEAEDALGHQLDRLGLALQDLTSGEGPMPAVSELLRQRDSLQQQIAVSREVYHRVAQEYNAALAVFPTTVAAALLRFHAVPEVPVGPLRR
jgi:LemA protein